MKREYQDRKKQMTEQATPNNHEQYHIRLVPEERGFHLKLGELWAYRDLVGLLTKKTFAVTYQQTVLGPLWILINPLLSSLIYLLVFGQIARVGTAGVPQSLFYFVSSSVWELCSFSVNSNASTFVSNANLFSKVYFPRAAVPMSNMFVSILKFCVQLMIIGVLIAVFLARGAIHPLWHLYPLLPLLFLQMSMLGMCVGILLSSMTTKYRDLLHVVSVGVTLWMYATPVVYPIQTIQNGILQLVIKLNPASQLMELIRLIMLGEGQFEWRFYLFGTVLTIALFVVSLGMFNKVERTFADTV